MKRVKNKLLKIMTLVGLIISFIAMTGAAAASTWLFYQPKEPKCLE